MHGSRVPKGVMRKRRAIEVGEEEGISIPAWLENWNQAKGVCGKLLMVCRKVEDGVLSSMALLIIDKTGLGSAFFRDERWLAVQGVGMLEFWQKVFKSWNVIHLSWELSAYPVRRLAT